MAAENERRPTKAECIAAACDIGVQMLDELEREEDRANGIQRGPFRRPLDRVPVQPQHRRRAQ